MVPLETVFTPAIETVTLVSDSAQYCNLLPGIRCLYRWIRPNRLPATPLDGAHTVGELIDDNDRVLRRRRSCFFFFLCAGTRLLSLDQRRGCAAGLSTGAGRPRSTDIVHAA